MGSVNEKVKGKEQFRSLQRRLRPGVFERGSLIALCAGLFFGLATNQTASAEPSMALSQPSDETRTDTPSGLPVPRFVSLKSATTNCRLGPSLDHPKILTFTRRGLPVRVIAETVDHWRKIEDHEGDQCWVHATLLSGNQTALIIEDGAPMFAKPDDRTILRARMAQGVIAIVRKCRGTWCEIEADSLRGWVSAHSLWGFQG